MDGEAIYFTGRGGAGNPPFPAVRGGAGNPPPPRGEGSPRDGASIPGILLLVEVESNIAKLFLDVPDNLSLSTGVEGVAPFIEHVYEEVGEVTSST